MSWTLVSLHEAAAQPWRNGGGRTRELLAWPAAADWRVRISVADVEAPGPFSRFEGIERWFAVLEGDGVVLAFAGASHRMTAADAPLRFDGAEAVDCTLPGGPTRDLNLMAPPGRARMQRVADEHPFHASAGTLLALYTHAQPARIECAGEHFAVPAFNLAWHRCSGEAAGRVLGAPAFWMEASP